MTTDTYFLEIGFLQGSPKAVPGKSSEEGHRFDFMSHLTFSKRGS